MKLFCTSEKPLAVIAKAVPIDPLCRRVPIFSDPWAATPGTKVANCAKVRPFNGRSFSVFESIVVPTTALSVWTAIAVAETSET